MKKIFSLVLALLITAVSAHAEVELRRQKNVATRYLVGIRNSSTGVLITGATGLDTECDTWTDSTNPDGFADATNEATEIGSTGVYYVNLTQSEMNFDYIVCQTKSSSSNAMTAIVFIDTTHGTVLTNSSGQLSTGTIAAASFSAGAIDASAIATDAIGAAEIAADAIGASEIATDAIGAAEVAADAIGASEIAANAIAAAEVADGAIDAATFASGAIDATAIAADAIGASEIATDAIGAAELAANAITSSEVANGTLTSAKFGYDGTLTSESGTTLGLASGAVDADDQFNNGFAVVVYDSAGLIEARSCIVDSVNTGDTIVTAQDISGLVAVADGYIVQPDAGCTSIVGSFQTGAITAAAFTAGAIDAAAIAADAIGASEVAANAIGAAEIADASIDAATFAAGAIDATAIAADAIGASEIAANAIAAAEVADGAIDAATLAADTITAAKIDSTADTEIENSVWNALLSGHTTAGSYGQALQIVRSGTAQAGAGTTITLDASASAADDFYNFSILQIVGGTGAGQGRIIEDYVGATKVATVAAWVTNPDNTSVFVIRALGQIPGASAPSAADVADAVWDELHSAHLGAGSFGLYIDAAVSTAGGSAANVRKW